MVEKIYEFNFNGHEIYAIGNLEGVNKTVVLFMHGIPGDRVDSRRLEVPWFMIGMGFLICRMVELPALIIGCIGFEMVILNKEKRVCGKMLNRDFKVIACSRAIILGLLAFMMYTTVSKFPHMIFLTGAMVYSILFIVSYDLHALIENKARAFEKVNISYMRKIA